MSYHKKHKCCAKSAVEIWDVVENASVVAEFVASKVSSVAENNTEFWDVTWNAAEFEPLPEL